MKKFLSGVLALLVVWSIIPLAGFTAFAQRSGDFEYEVLSESDKTCEITDYHGSATVLDIPAQLDGYTVTSIGDWAFYYCDSLTQVTIPGSVTSIGRGAFEGCDSLTQVTIPNSVTSIGDAAFAYCDSLTEVTIPGSVTSIGYYAFLDCDSLTEVTIQQGVTSIGYDAFEGCDSLTEVTIPGSVTSIGGDAFYNCDSLTEVTIPGSVTSIGYAAFCNCDSLTEIQVDSKNTAYSSKDGVLFNKSQTELIQYPAGKSDASYTIPQGVTSIGYAAFSDCTSLTQVTIPEGVTSIGYAAFSDCYSLTQVTISEGVTSIGDWAFSDCTSLTQVTIPDSVTSIGYAAFYNCDSLTEVTIPGSVTSIGGDAFYNCDSLTEVTIPNSVTSIGNGAFLYCDSLTEVTIQQGVTSIGSYAFSDCSSLTAVTIPGSVTSIGEDAFYGCHHLTQVTIPQSVTYIANDAFDDSGLTTIYGYRGSYAETYAKQHGYTFLDIPTGAATGSILYRNNVQMMVFDRTAFLEGRIDFSSSSASKQHALSGVTLRANGNSNTFDENFAFTSAYLGTDMRLSKANYQTVIIPAAVTASWMESDDLGTRNIYMAKDKKDGKPYIAGAFGRENGSSVAYTDLQCESLTALADTNYDILLTAELGGETAREYVLSQDNAHRLTSANGKFSNQALAKSFQAGKPVYAYVQTASGKTSETVKLNLDITSVALNTNTFSLIGKKGQSITLDKSNPLVGGAEISMDGFNFPLGIEVEGNRFKISFGIDIFSSKNGKKAGTWDLFKQSVGTITNSVDSTTEKLKHFNNFYKTFNPNYSYNEKSKNFDVSFLGYAEGYIVDDNFIFTDTCGEIAGKFSFQYTQQGTIWVIPVYAYVKAGAGLSVKAQGVRMLPDSNVPFDFGLDLKIEPELSIGGGVGVKGAVSGGLYGKGSLPFENNFTTKHTLVQLKGEIGVEGELFCFSGKKDILSGSVTLWDNYYGSAKSILAKMYSDFPNRSSSDETQTTVMSRDYAEKTSKWLGSSLSGRIFKTRSTVAEGLTVKELQKSVFKNSATQLVALNDGRMMLAYIEDDADRDTYNRMRLVYSIYENGSWSKPKAVADDGTNDASPSLATDGENIYVAWQNLNRTLTKSDADSIDAILDSSEIALAKFNTKTNSFGSATELTSNNSYDYSPSVAVENGNAAVYWINNAMKDLTVPKSNTMYRHLTAAKKTETVQSELNYILDMESAFANGVSEVAYSMDTDGVLSGTQDVCVFRLANGVQTQVSSSDTADFDVAVGVLDGRSTLFYANGDGIYYAGENGTKAVFDTVHAVNGDLQVLENGNQTNLMWTELSDAGTELWLCNYANGKWSEPVQISEIGALLSNISAVYSGGTIHGVFDRTERTLADSEYVSGQTDLCYMTLSDYTDLEAGFALIDETAFAVGENVPVSVYLKNNGTKHISSVHITLQDTLGTTITVQKSVDLPSGAETIINVDYPVPVHFGKTTLEVKASVPNESEINTTNNADSEEIGLANICMRDITTEQVGEYYIFTSVVTNNSLSPAENIKVNIYESGNEEKFLNSVKIGTLQAGESYSVQYVVEKEKLNFDADGLCKIQFSAVTDSTEKTDADNKAYSVCKADIAPIPDVTLGDINGDKTVDAIDARWVLQASTNSRELTVEQQAAADVNADGVIDAIDARWILQASTGSRTL